MQTTYTPAPFTGRGYVAPGPMTLDVTDNGSGVTVKVANAPFLPSWLKVGKEYSPVATIDQAREYPGQIVECVPNPDGGELPLPQCGSQTWDSVINFVNDISETGAVEITTPYNNFMLAANGCAFQTDGVERVYFLEMETPFAKCKILFKFTTPVAPWAYPGQTTPPATGTTTPGKKGKNHH